MAEERNTKASAGREPSRLQRRAPASIQIAPAKEWNDAIPLLTPLIPSPTSEILIMGDIVNGGKEVAVTETNKPPPPSSSLAINMWQHPAAPFGFDPPEMPFVPFFCTGNLGR